MTRIALAVALSPLVAACASARDIHVDPKSGDDAVDGSTSPVRTILRAVRLAGPGDTVHLAKAVYRESIDLTAKSGEPGRPLVIDGHGAIINGEREIDPAEWQETASDLYRNRTLFRQPLRELEEWVWRWFFLFDGKINRMGRCMKGTNAAYRKPSELLPGEWTYRQDEDHAFYVKTKPGQDLSSARIATPWLVNGVSVHGQNHDLVIKNITATHVLNDGYSISTVPDDGYIQRVRFENVGSVECGDDGLSAHGNNTVEVDGFYSTGNGTGICTIGNSVNNRLLLVDNVGFELYFLDPYGRPEPTTHVITNSRIVSRATNGILVRGGDAATAICTLKLENVVISGSPRRSADSTRLRIDPRGRLEARHVTIVGHTVSLSGEGASVTDSVITGGSIDIGPHTAWEARRNVYDLSHINVGGVSYTQATLAAYKQATAQDATSRWEDVDADRLLTGARLELEGEPVGGEVPTTDALIPGRSSRVWTP